MSTHEWDLSHARAAAAFIAGLEAELVAAHHKIERLEERAERLEVQVLIRDDIIDSVIDERDRAIDRCVARVATHGTPGPVTLHGMAGEWQPGPSADDDASYWAGGA